MNFDAIHSYIADAVSDRHDGDLFVEAIVRRDFGVPRNRTTQDRLRKNERSWSQFGDGPAYSVVTSSGLCKLAFFGSSVVAQGLREFVAGEFLPALDMFGSYLADDYDEGKSVIRNMDLAYLRKVACWQQALQSTKPEGRDLQDYLAEIALPPLFEQGRFKVRPDCERFASAVRGAGL